MKRAKVVVLVLVAAVAIGEVWLLGWVGSRIGIGWLLLVLLGEAMVGGWLMQREGRKAWGSLIDAREHPDGVGARVTDAALVLVGGVLLVLPGFLSDVVGLICLLPPTRGLARRGVMAVIGALTRPYRDQADLLRAKLERDQVVEGETVRAPGTPQPEDPTIIRGEIEP